MTRTSTTKHIFMASVLLWAGSGSVFGQTPVFTQGGTGQPSPSAQTILAAGLSASNAAASAPELDPLQKLMDQKIPDAIAKGKFDLDVRLRFEDADEYHVKTIHSDSVAPTVRTRFGYTSAPLYGFQAMLQAQNTSVLGPEGNYNAAGTDGKGYKPTINDPPVTDLDQAWLAYAYTNIVGVKAGRQRLVLDNQRFIGDADWRQNIQTFDAVTLHVEPFEHLDLFYGYIWDVHRPYGNVSGLSTTNRDFQSDSHLVNVSYSGWDYGRFVGYTYLLSLTNPAGANNSCATYGAYFAGDKAVNDYLALDYRAELAWQTDYGRSTLSYGTEYWNLEMGANIKPFAVGGGCESLGSGENSGKAGGRAAFRTPLDTPHPFDGWAEVFGSAPSTGLRDVYGYAQVTLPEKIPLRCVYHKFDATYGDGDFGQEVDLIATKDFGKHWHILLEYAYYAGANAAPPVLAVAHVDVQRWWTQLTFTF
jgi:hypothetical protein